MTSFKRWFGAGAIVLVALALVACPAMVPKIKGSIPDMEFKPGVTAAQTVTNLGQFFDQVDSSTEYSAASSNKAVATAKASGTTLTVAPVGPGSARVTVTATKGKESADQVFNVTVQKWPAPAVANEIDDMTFAHNGGPQSVNLTDKFRNVTADGYSAKSGDQSVVTAGVSGAVLTVTRVGAGNTNVTVSATGNDGTKVSQSVAVEVQKEPSTGNNPPRLKAGMKLEDRTGLKSDGDPVEIELLDYFVDDDNDDITFDARSSKPSVATEEVKGALLTIKPIAPGTSTITVEASDADTRDSPIVTSFDVTVANQAPVLNSSLPLPGPLSLYPGKSSNPIDVSNHFSDFENPGYPNVNLSYEAASSDDEIATVSRQDSVITITASATAVAGATATITVTASDGELSTSGTITVRISMVPNVAPNVVGDGIPDREDLVRDFDKKSETFDVSMYFNDEDGDNDDLTYSVTPATESGLATAAISGKMLTITAVPVANPVTDSPGQTGTATFTVTANDGTDDSPGSTFNVMVGNPAVPKSLREIDNRTGDKALNNQTPVDVPFAGHFERATGYMATPNDPAIVTAEVDDDHTKMTLTPMGVGTTVVIVESYNSGGKGDTESVTVTVEGMAPKLKTGMTFGNQTTPGADRLTVVRDDGNGDPNDTTDDGLATGGSVDGTEDVEFSAAELLVVDDATERYMLLDYVTDPDGDDTKLTFSTSTSDNNVVAVYDTPTTAIVGEVTDTGPPIVRVNVSGRNHLGNPTDAQLRQRTEDGPDITIRGRSEGTATIKVTATDADGLKNEWTFLITVVSENVAPAVRSGVTFPGDRASNNPYRAFSGLGDARRFRSEPPVVGSDDSPMVLRIDFATMFQDPDRTRDPNSGRHTGDPWSFEAHSTDESVVTVSLASTNNAELHDEYDVTVTRVGSGNATIYFVVTDSFGESAGGVMDANGDFNTANSANDNTYFAVRVNSKPVAQGGQTSNPQTLGAVNTYLNLTVGDLGSNDNRRLLRVVDDSNTNQTVEGYFSDGDSDTLACRLVMTGDPIWGTYEDGANAGLPVKPGWVSATTRQVIQFAEIEETGTARIQVWCWDQVGGTDFEESPSGTLTVDVKYDASVQ